MLRSDLKRLRGFRLILKPTGIRRSHWIDHSFAVYVCIPLHFPLLGFLLKDFSLVISKASPTDSASRVHVTRAKVCNTSRSYGSSRTAKLLPSNWFVILGFSPLVS